MPKFPEDMPCTSFDPNPPGAAGELDPDLEREIYKRVQTGEIYDSPDDGAEKVRAAWEVELQSGCRCPEVWDAGCDPYKNHGLHAEDCDCFAIADLCEPHRDILKYGDAGFQRGVESERQRLLQMERSGYPTLAALRAEVARLREAVRDLSEIQEVRGAVIVKQDERIANLRAKLVATEQDAERLREALTEARTCLANLALEITRANLRSATMERHAGIGVRMNNALAGEK